MVYQNKLVAAIKVNDQILREKGNSVTLPFGSEYSILLKNLNSVRVQVKVSVDGKDATEGTWLIIYPNASLELERFISDGNLTTGNRFKFIERTTEVEAHRGVGVEDGIVRVEYKTERVQEIENVPIRRYYDELVRRPYLPPWYPDRRRGTPMRSLRATASASLRHPTRTRSSSRSATLGAAEGAIEDHAISGITVPGSQSHQQFHHVSAFDTHEQSEVLILRLFGQVAGKAVKAAVFSKSKQNCPTCGKANRSDVQFCGRCGTALTVY